MTSQPEPDRAWGALVDQAEGPREKQMEGRYNELAAQSEDERLKRLHAMAVAEYALSDDKLRAFSLSRMRVYLRIDTEKARKVVHSYDTVMQQMPGGAAMRRVALVQTLARSFTPEEQERLRALLPRMFADRPLQAAASGDQPAAPPATPAQPPPAATKKPRWAFWKKG